VGGNKIDAHATNIGAGGAYLRCLKQSLKFNLNPGTKIHLSLQLPLEPEAVTCDGKIAWIESDDHDVTGQPVCGIGIEFENLSEDFSEKVKSFVDLFRYTLLVVGNDRDECKEAIDLVDPEFACFSVHGVDEAVRYLRNVEIAVMIVFEQDADSFGLELFKRASEALPYSNTIRLVVSPGSDTDQTQAYLRLGKVFQHLPKPFGKHQLVHLVRRSVEVYALAVENSRREVELKLEQEELRRENEYLRQRLDGSEEFEHILGRSQRLRQALTELKRVRESDATVHISGETGTGKELFLRELHYGGPRASGPLISQNCAGLSETLLQSILFGHKKGAFTGAHRDHVGLFQQAHGGTLYLDEVAELPIVVQGVLLRALQERKVLPLGAAQEVDVDIRVISATHKNLRAEVQSGNFREDLYFRLVVIHIEVPPLRERQGDVPILANHLLSAFKQKHQRELDGFNTDVLAAFEHYAWPGNVRELENEVERMVILAPSRKPVTIDQVSVPIRESYIEHQTRHKNSAFVGPALQSDLSVGYDSALQEFQRGMISQALKQTSGHITQAARFLQMERSRLTKIIKRLDIESA
jgi:two-component system, NtrC family, response regulator HupR/HoxA